MLVLFYLARSKAKRLCSHFLLLSFHWPTVAVLWIFPLNSNTHPLSPQVVQMAWQEQTPCRAWWDCRQTVHPGRALVTPSTPHMAETLWWVLSELSLYFSQLPANRSCITTSLRARRTRLVVKGVEGRLVVGKNACVWLCVWWFEAVMLVSFSNSTDRWNRFDLKVVLISPSLWGEMGQSGWDNLHSLSGKLLERKSAELFVWFFSHSDIYQVEQSLLTLVYVCSVRTNWLLERVQKKSGKKNEKSSKRRLDFTCSQKEQGIALSLHFVILRCHCCDDAFWDKFHVASSVVAQYCCNWENTLARPC